MNIKLRSLWERNVIAFCVGPIKNLTKRHTTPVSDRHENHDFTNYGNRKNATFFFFQFRVIYLLECCDFSASLLRIVNIRFMGYFALHDNNPISF